MPRCSSARPISRTKSGLPRDCSWTSRSTRGFNVRSRSCLSTRAVSLTLSGRGSTWRRSRRASDVSRVVRPNPVRRVSRNWTDARSSRRAAKVRAWSEPESAHWASSTNTTTWWSVARSASRSWTPTSTSCASTGLGDGLAQQHRGQCLTHRSAQTVAVEVDVAEQVVQHTERVPLLALTRCRPEDDGAALGRQVGGVLPEGGLAEAGLAGHDQPTGARRVEERGQGRRLARRGRPGPEVPSSNSSAPRHRLHRARVLQFRS